jgi:hypothetical protein
LVGLVALACLVTIAPLANRLVISLHAMLVVLSLAV